ncbi:MAG: ankyrin repeat domain-containing protein, partial [Deltaproteobacteria bacterium]|nr:ankyrin repeat domain-containing protein [Deltaproteobacteria bacterium]
MRQAFWLVLLLWASLSAIGHADDSSKQENFVKLCRTGTPQAVEAAILDGADVNGEDWGPPLAAAAENPDLEVLSVLLKNGAKVSPHILVEIAGEDKPNPEAFALLLQNGGDVNAKAKLEYDEWMRTPLLRAATLDNPNLEFISFLLNNGADVNATVEADPDYGGSDDPPVRIETGWTALTSATGVEEPDLELVSLLLKNGADVNPKGDFKGETPLMTALSNRYCENYWVALRPRIVNLEVVDLLLKSGAKLDAADDDGATPLMYAADNSAEAVLLLLKNGADVNAADKEGLTTLMATVMGRHTPYAEDNELNFNLETVRLLLENGAEVDARDNNGRTALMLAAEGR